MRRSEREIARRRRGRKRRRTRGEKKRSDDKVQMSETRKKKGRYRRDISVAVKRR